VIFSQHENYNQGTNTYANDIAILHFASAINIGGNVQAALLPANNNNDYSGLTCVISGWGRTGKSFDIMLVNNIYTINRYEATMFNSNRMRPKN